MKKDDVPAAYAARTMMWSGPIIAAFIVFHILHLTVGTVVPLREAAENAPDVRLNVIAGFQNPVVSGFYIFAMILLCMHLYHGIVEHVSIGGPQPSAIHAVAEEGRGSGRDPDRHREYLDSARGHDGSADLVRSGGMELDSKCPAGPIETRWDRTVSI